MIELKENRLVFHFPEVHPGARLTVKLTRTVRVPDDGKDYPLPPALGLFPARHVDDHHDSVPDSWINRGGVMIPMHQSEAVWLRFQSSYIENQASYPFALKVGTGKISAITGKAWGAGFDGQPQDYVVVPKQPWLDGYSLGKGVVRQFVAMPLGEGYTAEEQITDAAEFGGFQLQAYPMKRVVFEKRFSVVKASDIRFAVRGVGLFGPASTPAHRKPDMGVAPGGRIKQQVFDDPYDLTDWDLNQAGRCFVHLCNSQQWQAITDDPPPFEPLTAQAYTKAGFPWFGFYEETPALDGSAKLAALETVADHAKTIGDPPLANNASVTADHVVELRRGLKDGQVREFES